MAAKIKSIVFRVTGLGADQPNDELEAALKAVINRGLLEEEKSGINAITAIVPSCYDSEREKVALVEFRGGVPKFLSKLVAHPLEDWQTEMGDADINFDCNFFGFTQLYATRPGEPVTAE
jgi:hypothetical protein